MSTGESGAQKLNYQAQWQNFLYETKMQIAGGSWILKPVKAFCGPKGLKCNLQVCFANGQSRQRTFRTDQKKKIFFFNEHQDHWKGGSQKL